MHVTSLRQGRRRSMRPPLAAVLMFALAGLGGVAHAAEFDEKLKAPSMKSVADFKTQAQSFATTYREIGAATPAQLITNVSLARKQFDLSWQVTKAVNERRPLGELDAVGFVSDGNGGYTIDTKKYPEWSYLGEKIAGVFNSNLRDQAFEELLIRGFRPADVATMTEYIATHDVKHAARQATLPIVLGLQRSVRKFDKAGKPVPDALVVSYLYQSSRAQVDASRAWSEGLLKTLDAQRGRVLLSYLSEGDSYRTLTPDDVPEAIKGTLALVRSPDFEKRLQITDGDAP